MSLVLATSQIPTVANATELGTTTAPPAENESALFSQANSDYDTSSPKSAIALAAAASNLADPSSTGDTTTSRASTVAPGTVAIGADGTVSVASTSDVPFQVTSEGTASSAVVVNNSVVQSDVAPSTDLVTRVTPAGVQLVAILSDAQAPPKVGFDLALPAGASLEPKPDGSLVVMAPAEVTTVDPAGFDSMATRAEAIVAGATDPTQITPQQWNDIEALPAVPTTTTTVKRTIATIEAPWAVDAKGAALETHYELGADGTSLTQVLETNKNTAYPVTADPNVLWWTWTAMSCVVDLAALIFAAAKLTKLLLGVKSLMKKSVALTNVINKMGGIKAFLTAIYDAARGFVEGKVGKYLSGTSRLALAGAGAAAVNLAGDLLGIGSCFSLIRALA